MREIYGKPLTNHNFADLHFHTTGSLDVRRRGNGLSPQEATLSAEAAGIHTLAITDHDFLPSSYEAYEFAQREGLKVDILPGMELSAKDGHLIALGLTSPIEKNLSMENSIREIHKQKGLVIAAHPFFVLLNSPKRAGISRILRSLDPEVYFDGFEIYNTGVEDAAGRKRSIKDTNDFARRFFTNHSPDLGASIGSSDGHRMTVGRGLTAYTGDLKDAISQRRTLAVRMDPSDNRRLVLNAIALFGQERVLGETTMDEFENRFKEVDP